MTVKKETVARTIVLALALINQVLTMLGINPLPFSEDTVYEAITLIATVITSIAAWWCNNSFTKNAIAADNYLKKLEENR